MGIEIMIMPLSRYWAGDYITPTMQEAYRAGLDFNIIRPNEPIRHLESWSPFGGPNAPAERISLIQPVIDLMRQFPHGIAANLWDEASDIDPWIYKFHLEEISHFIDVAIEVLGKDSAAHILNACLFLPVDFPFVLKWEELCFGSLHQLQRELQKIPLRIDTENVYMIFDEAIRKALNVRLPLIYDD